MSSERPDHLVVYRHSSKVPVRNQCAYHDGGANAEEDRCGRVCTSHPNSQDSLLLLEVLPCSHCEYRAKKLCDTYDHRDCRLTGHDMLNCDGTKEASESSDAGGYIYASDRLECGVGERKCIIGFRSRGDECGDGDGKK